MGRGRALLLLALWQPGHSIRLQSVVLGSNVDGPAAGLNAALWRGRTAAVGENSTTNCTLFPDLCQPPFDCQLPLEDKPMLATRDGHVDYHTWCGSNYALPAMLCQQGDLKGYARSMYTMQKNVSELVLDLDSHYCFAFGFCDHTYATENTTLAEAEALCDDKLGHEAWTRQPPLDKLNTSLADIINATEGLHLSERAERNFARSACAQGNFHCDAVYCHENFCREPLYRAKWGSHRPKDMIKLHGDDYPPGFRAP